MISPELIETQPIDIAKPDLYTRLLGTKAIDVIIADNIELGRE